MSNVLEKLHDPKTQKQLGIAACALILLWGGYALCRSLAPKSLPEKSIPVVRTFTVGQSKNSAPTPYPGTVRGRYESQLAFQAGGKISSRRVNVGDRVQVGQLLLTLDPQDLAQNAEAANAQLASARSGQKLAADNAARYNQLYAQGAVSESIRDQYNNQLEAANAALRQAQAQSVVSGNQLGYTQLLSDADGVVAAINVEIGQVVSAGTPILTLVRNGEREVQIYLPEGTTAQVGQQAEITLWALPDMKLRGSVREIAPMADSVTRTYKVCIAVPELPQIAKLGMTAKVSLLSEATARSSFIIPGAAIYQVKNTPQIWLVRDKKVQLQEVRIAGYNGNDVQISDGLQAGDVIVTAGLAKLNAGQEVQLEQGGEQ